MDGDKLQLLVDRAEIEDVVLRYARAIDMRDWKLYHTCFTDELDVDLTELRGEGNNPKYEHYVVDDWVKLVSSLERYKATQHVNTNFTIEVDGDGASCINYIHAQHYGADHQGEDTWNIIGWYRWGLVRTPGGWKINRMKEYARWFTGERR